MARFKPLPHRLELVRERCGVLYVNDSKCTTVSSLKVALQAFDRPLRLLCGGKFKGGDLVALGRPDQGTGQGSGPVRREPRTL